MGGWLAIYHSFGGGGRGQMVGHKLIQFSDWVCMQHEITSETTSDKGRIIGSSDNHRKWGWGKCSIRNSLGLMR